MVTLSSAAETLAASPLMHVGGWSVARVLNDRARAALAAEARRCHATGATEARLEASPDEELVRGNPARWLESAPGGPVVDGLYRAPVLHAWLRRLTGLDWEPSGGLGSYSYYRVVFAGPPRALVDAEGSLTGRHLKEDLAAVGA